MAKNKKWIQAASASIKKRGTAGVCTGDKFGGPTCPPGSKRYNLAKVFKGMASKKKKAATGAMIHAQHGVHAQVRSSLAAKGMKAATAGTAYKSPGWINKNLNKLKDFMKAGTKTTSMKGSITPSKWLSKIPKGSQLKTLAKAGGRRSLALAGGPIGLGMYAGTSLAKAAVTSAFKGYKKEGKWTKEGTKRLESQARAREALMAKRNKARNAQTGAMIRATHGVEVLGKQSVPFESQGATANLAAERQGRKGAAVRGFNFKGVF